MSASRSTSVLDPNEQAGMQTNRQNIGGYEVVSKLGEGSMGVVYRARQVSLDRIVALKVLAPELARDAEYIVRFKRETIAAARLNHPNIVSVFEAGECDGAHYLAMEYIEGHTLADRIQQKSRVEPDEALAICVYVAEALHHAWQRAQLIHRDIKPANIFLSNEGEVKLGDLGLARQAGEQSARVTQSNLVVCTPQYCSPEQARGQKDLDFRADIYSLGCTLFHMLTGREPYEGDDAMAVLLKQVSEPPPVITRLWPQCPAPLVFVLNRMLAKNRDARHGSYSELIAQLRAVREAVMNPAAAPATGAQARAGASPAAASRRMPPWLWVGLGAAAAVAVALWTARSGGKPAVLDETTATVPTVQVHPEVPEVRRAAAPAKPPPAIAPVERTVAATNAQPERPVAATSTNAGETARIAAVSPAAETSTATNTAPSGFLGTPVTESSSRNPVATTNTPLAAATEQPVMTASAAQPVPAVTPPVAMTAEELLRTTMARLKELNPRFDGREAHRFENGRLVDLTVSTAHVADISPLSALRDLRRLVLSPWAVGRMPPAKGLVSDLAALRGLKLTVLSCSNTRVQSLEPLTGMPLTVLWCDNALVTDLEPLRGMPLTELRCDFVAERDSDVVRSITTLRMINGLTAAAFWLKVEPDGQRIISGSPRSSSLEQPRANRGRT